MESIQSLHFLRPQAFWLMLALLLFWWWNKRGELHSVWETHMPPAMVNALLVSNDTSTVRWRSIVLALGMGIIVATAGPSWQQQSVPVVKNQNALVVVLDLSPSMMAEDLKPNRLTRAKYKLIDIFRLREDGQTALVAYSGDAYTVSPLTDDARTIEALLPALSPNIMPTKGSNIESALELANSLLLDAGANRGNIIVVTDGIDQRAFDKLSQLTRAEYPVSILAAASDESVPIPQENGGFIKNSSGEIILIDANLGQLSALAPRLGGRFSTMQVDDSDINYLVDVEAEANSLDQLNSSDIVYDAWVDRGHLLALLILPLALFLFRKGLVYSILMVVMLPMLTPSTANASNETKGSGWWQTANQKAKDLFQQGQFEAAANMFEDPHWAALAHYKSNNFAKAAELLKEQSDATSLYNRANAMAMYGELESALALYDNVLQEKPNHVDALHNKQVVEELLKQQQQQQNQQDGESDNQQNQPQNSDSQGQEPDQQENQQSKNPESDNNSSAAPDQGDNSQKQNSENSDSDEAQPQDQNNSEQGDGSAEDQEDNASPEAAEPERPDSEQSQVEPSEESASAAQETPERLANSSEQWLRTIPDDPSGLLRRKFEYQSQQRQRNSNLETTAPDTQQRY